MIKRITCALLALAMTLSVLPTGVLAEDGSKDILFSTDFSQNTTPEGMNLNGSAKIENGELVLNGTSDCYANLTNGLLNGLDEATISFDVTTNMAGGNYFTFAIGQDTSRYFYLRFRGGDAGNYGNYYGAITQNGFGGETSVKGLFAENVVGTSQAVSLVFDGNTVSLYVDGQLVRANYNLSEEVTEETPHTERTKADVQREIIVRALRNNNGRRRDAARELFMSERTLYRRIKELGITDDDI